MRIRTTIMTAALAAFLVLPAEGQVRLGVVGGGTLASFSGENMPEISMKPGGAAGVVLSFALWGPVRMESGVAWSQRRMGVDVEAGAGRTFSSVTELAYLEVPMTLEVGVVERGPWMLALKGGPQVSMKVKEPEAPISGRNASFLDDLDYRSTDLALGVGGALGYRQVFVDARYAFGLENAVEEGSDAPELKARVLSVVVGFWLPLRRGPEVTARR